jgi:hypothetical protein
MSKAKFTCPLKGCRASELSARMNVFMNSVLNLRSTLVPVVGVDTQPTLTRMLAVAQVKFGLVDDLPFFLWQVNSPQSARTFFGQVWQSAVTAPSSDLCGLARVICALTWRHGLLTIA